MTDHAQGQPSDWATARGAETASGTIPVFLKLDDRPCLVIGGGTVATRKASWLLEAGARVHVMAPEICPDLRAKAAVNRDRMTLEIRAYDVDRDDVAAYAMIFVACGQPHVNEAVSHRARVLGIPVNVADVPDLCTFYVPATIRRGSLCVAIGTGGDCPSLAGCLRRDLEDHVQSWLGDFTEALRRVRVWLLENEPDGARRMAVMKHLAALYRDRDIIHLATHDMEQRLRVEARRFLRDQR